MILNFITDILGEYEPVVSSAGEISVNYGYVFDALALLGFSFLIFSVIIMIVKAVFFK